MATIWCVDDEEPVRVVMESMIKSLGYQVQLFSSGEEALSAYKQADVAPDIVITDVRMPGMNGLELTRAIAAFDPSAIIFILTAYPSIPTAVESIRNGAIEFLTKPCRIETMRTRIQHALESRDLRARMRKSRMVAWCVVASLPIWVLLGLLLARILRS